MPIPEHIKFDDGKRRGEGADALVQTATWARRMLKIVMILLCVGYCFSNYIVLDSNEQAFVLRFGALSGDKVKKPGRSYWAAPKPFSQVVRIRAEKAHTVHTGFWYNLPPNTDPATSPPQPQFETGADDYLLTGDYNIVHAKWALTYIIEDPVAYHFDYNDPDNLVEAVLRNAVIKETAAIAIDNVLYSGSEELRRRVERRVRQELKTAGIGIAVTSDDQLNVFYHQKQVPRQVLEAFSDVTGAEQDYSQAVNRAEADARQIVQGAQGEAAAILAEAAAYREQTVAETQADADYFSAILESYRSSRGTLLITLFQQTLAQMVGNARDVYFVHPGQEIRLLTNRPARSPRPPPGSEPEGEEHGHDD
ncbi:MAG: membrane protease subunit HflK [Rhodothermales bacterium]|jgi:membrane protease subunit HflK